PNAPPDLFIEVAYGQDMTPRVDPGARETYLQMSARNNPTRAIDKGTGEELWDVRVAVLGIAGRMETALPLLCSVASSYIGINSMMETKIDVPQNAPEIAQIRESAIRSLETKDQPAPPMAPLPAPPAPPPPAKGGFAPASSATPPVRGNPP